MLLMLDDAVKKKWTVFLLWIPYVICMLLVVQTTVQANQKLWKPVCTEGENSNPVLINVEKE